MILAYQPGGPGSNPARIIYFCHAFIHFFLCYGLCSYEKETKCWICKEEFNDDKNYKVRDHCHFTGRYRGAAHNSCNLKYRKPNFTPVVFHNLSGYDSHLFIKNLGFSQGKIDCIPNNEERYISFTKSIEVGSYTTKEGETKPYIIK